MLILAAKCDSTTCTALQTSLTPLQSCLTDPTAAACTGKVNLPPPPSLPISLLSLIINFQGRTALPQTFPVFSQVIGR